MKNSKIVVVVLNYINFQDTIACVNSILEQTYKNFNIVIVDNGSPNDSYAVLSNLFDNNPYVKLIKSSKNLGFARGNNVGIDYARSELKAELLFILNSDTILGKYLLEEVVSLKVESDIGAFSPTVINFEGEVQDPTEQVNNIFVYTTKKFLYLNYSILRRHLKFLNKIYYNLDYGNRKVDDMKYIYRINGSAFFLTPVFFKYYDKPYPATFLYWEEINLIWYLYKVGLRSDVYETSGVLHKESKSADLAQKLEPVSVWKLRKSYASFLKSIPVYILPFFIIRRLFK